MRSYTVKEDNINSAVSEILQYRQTVRQTDRQTNRQTDRQTNRQTDKQTDKQTDRRTDRQTDRQTNRQTDRQLADRQTRTDRQTETDRPREPVRGGLRRNGHSTTPCATSHERGTYGADVVGKPTSAWPSHRACFRGRVQARRRVRRAAATSRCQAGHSAADDDRRPSGAVASEPGPCNLY